MKYREFLSNGGTELGYEVGELDIMGNKKNAEFEGHDIIFSLLTFFFIPFSALMFYVNFLVTVNAASVRLKADKSD